MTVLFCDLVGFTARSEQLDPEDVSATLAPYHARLRAVLEQYGGRVEKFIGDAVMAVFGVPVAHEDDPARALGGGTGLLRPARLRLTPVRGRSKVPGDPPNRHANLVAARTVVTTR